MAFLGRGRKDDLLNLTTELNIAAGPNLKVIEIKELILKSDSYDEEFVKCCLETIVATRKEKEEREREDELREAEREDRLREAEREDKLREAEREDKLREAEREDRLREAEREEKRRKEQMDFELAKLKLETRCASSEILGDGVVGQKRPLDLKKLIPPFDSKNDDISLFLVLFERQAKRAEIEDKHWVSHLVGLLPSEIAQLIAREPESKANDYNHMKDLLLKRFKLSAEKFRLKFVTHQKRADSSWKDFLFELKNYFQEWIDGLNIESFDQLKDLIVTDQLKKRVESEVREHFIDRWSKITSASELVELLDEYENVRSMQKRPKGNFSREVKPKWGPKAPLDTRKKESHLNTNFKNWNNNASKMESTKTHYRPTCFSCGSEGHFARSCRVKNNTKNTSTNAQSNLVQMAETSKGANSPVLTARITVPVSTPVEPLKNIDQLKIVQVKCGNKWLNGIIDSGAQISVVRADLIADVDSEGEGKIEITSAFGESEIAPLKIVHMKIDDGLHGSVPITCAVSKKLVSDMLICQTAYDALMENIQLFSSTASPTFDTNETSVVEKTEMNVVEAGEVEESSLTEHDLPDSMEENENRKSFMKLQKEDISLKDIWTFAENCQRGYEVQDGVLIHNDQVCGEEIKQIVLPLCKRNYVLKMAHDIPLAGHLGESKTKQRIKYSFFWPSLKKDVKKYCESCKPCQLRRTVTYRDRVPIQPIVRPELPFEVWSVDCIGPLEPASGHGHKYIICAVDLCTRWAEAFPVKSISAKTTCDILMGIFTRTGFPKTICTDQGTNFTSQLSEAFLDKIGVIPRFATPGHPESMGAVERWNRTLKDMLNKNIQENGRSWDLHLPFLLFAYREVPHSTTGVSPFQLVYGRLPPGPLNLVKNSWIGEKQIPLNASSTVEQYIEDLQSKICKAHEIANENAEKNQAGYKNRYNLRSREKSMEVGDQVLILHPSSTHKLLKTWMGPVTVKSHTRPHSVLVEFEDGSTRELHVNKVRPYIARIQHVGLVFDQDTDFGDLHYVPTDKKQINATDINRLIEGMKDTLGEDRHHELTRLLCRYTNLFSDKPGCAKVDGHAIKVTSDCTPKRLSPYRVPIALREEVDRQVKELLDLGLIEPSDSDWSHPLVCVAKKDGTVRLCVDYRLLNSFTIPDAYPMQNATELLYEIGGAAFISVIDLTKGYWQIPMREDSKSYTAFVTHSGHYQWTVLPFGLRNAGSTFQRSLDKVLCDYRKYCRSYIDDVAIFSNSWEEHLLHISRVFQTLVDVGLTVNLRKCDFGKTKVKFLGHIVGSGTHAPDPDRIQNMKCLSRPVTKRDLRGIIGLTSYYRDYIADFSQLVLPLTNLTKKNIPNKIPWGEVEEKAFQELKRQLVEMPSLATPSLDRPFQLYTDASSTAIGACLAQNDETGQEKPIAFYSKKLSPCQTRWSTIEREAYAVLAALNKFDTWIFGTEVQVVSDHNPLTFLTQGVPHGAKLARWALALQRYNVTLSYRKGSKHGNADALSRLKFDDHG